MIYRFGIKDKPFSIVPDYVDAKKNENLYEIKISDNVLQGMLHNDGSIIFNIANIRLKFLVVMEHGTYARLKFENLEV